MIKIILGFLPWILYFILLGTTRQQHEIAVGVALLTTICFDFRELKKGFILTWGNLLFFGLFFIVILFVSSDWPERYANLLANSALAAIAWFSLAINKPFTLQYAREQVAKEFWLAPGFIFVNRIITTVWALSFSISVTMNILQLNSIISDNWFYQTLSYIPTIVAILFTKKFPDWYKQYSIKHKIDQARQKQKTNQFLMHNFAPVIDELDVDNLIIEGELPKDLSGIYMRNGPNPAFPPFSYTYPFDGDGMLHAFYFKNGNVSYKNRFIETDQLKVEQRLKQAIYGGVNCPLINESQLLKPQDPIFPVKLGRFIHIIRHANLYLALHEAAPAYEVDTQLQTLGVWNPTQASEAISVNAHTRLDPKTGDLFFIAYDSENSAMTFYVIDKNAQLIQSGSIKVPHCCMVHDFTLTENYVIIFLCPVTVDFSRAILSKPIFAWQPELNTQIALLPRHNLGKDIIWIETEAFFSYHFANAYEVDQKILVDHVRYSEFSMVTENLKPAHLYRTTIDPHLKQCIHEQKDDRSIEFPRINDHYNSISYRYIYTLANLTGNKEVFNAIIKYDLKTGHSTLHDFGSDYEIGEAVFAPSSFSKDEDDGYLILLVYNKTKNNSDLVILNAHDITTKPLAHIKLPRRIPHGLHGSWMAD